MKATKKKRITIKGGGEEFFFLFYFFIWLAFQKNKKKYFRQLIYIWTYHVKVYSWYFYWFVTIFSQKCGSFSPKKGGRELSKSVSGYFKTNFFFKSYCH